MTTVLSRVLHSDAELEELIDEIGYDGRSYGAITIQRAATYVLPDDMLVNTMIHNATGNVCPNVSRIIIVRFKISEWAMDAIVNFQGQSVTLVGAEINDEVAEMLVSRIRSVRFQSIGLYDVSFDPESAMRIIQSVWRHAAIESLTLDTVDFTSRWETGNGDPIDPESLIGEYDVVASAGSSPPPTTGALADSRAFVAQFVDWFLTARESTTLKSLRAPPIVSSNLLYRTFLIAALFIKQIPPNAPVIGPLYARARSSRNRVKMIELWTIVARGYLPKPPYEP